MENQGDSGGLKQPWKMWSAVERSHYGSYWEESVLGSARAVTCAAPLAPVCPAPTCLPWPLGVLPPELSSLAHALLSAPPVSLFWK